MLASSYVRRMPWFVLIWACALSAMGLAAIARGDELAGGGQLWSRQLEWILLSAWRCSPRRCHTIGCFGTSAIRFFGCLLLLGRRLSDATPQWGAALDSARAVRLSAVGADEARLHRGARRLPGSQQSYRELKGLLVPFVIALVPVGLILREPDLGTSLVFLPVLFSMLFAAGARCGIWSLIVLLAVPVLPLMWMGMSAEQKSRIVTLFVQRDGGPAPTGDGYHLHQSKQVLCARRRARQPIERHHARRSAGLSSARVPNRFCLLPGRRAVRIDRRRATTLAACIWCCSPPDCGSPPARANRLAACWPSASSR